MESAYALDCSNPALRNDPSGSCDRFTSPHILFSGEIHLRSAVIAADRLGIITPAQGGVILTCTGRAHREHLHARPLTVVRKSFQDRETRPAAGAVDKGMKISSVARIKKFPAALFADRNVRRDEDFPFSFGALYDLERVKTMFAAVGTADIHLEYSSSLRRLLFEKIQKRVHLILTSLGEDLHIRAFIADRTSDPGFGRVSRHSWAKANSLDNSVYFYSQCLLCISDHNLPETAKCGSPANTPSKYPLKRGSMTGSAMIISYFPERTARARSVSSLR